MGVLAEPLKIPAGNFTIGGSQGDEIKVMVQMWLNSMLTHANDAMGMPKVHSILHSNYTVYDNLAVLTPGYCF